MKKTVDFFTKGLNTKPTTGVIVHLTRMENEDLKINLTDRFTDSDSEEYRILSIANVDYFITEDQSERLFEVLEKGLYEETFKEIEDKYRTEKVRRERLEEEVEELRQQLSEVRRYA